VGCKLEANQCDTTWYGDRFSRFAERFEKIEYLCDVEYIYMCVCARVMARQQEDLMAKF